MNSILKASLSAAAIALSASASATVYYVSDCAAGAAAGCVPGNDANNGTSIATPWKTVAKASAMIGSLKPSDEVRFARGASFINAQLYMYNTASRAATPIVIDSYKPTWGTGTQKPILTAAAGATLVSFTDSGNADHDEGYTVRNLDLRGSGSGTGVFIYNDADYITMENLDISNFDIGIECSASNPANPGSDGQNDYITLRNSKITNNTAQGYLGACNHVLVENNRFDNNGYKGLLVRNHNIYIGGKSTFVTVRGNILTRSAVGSGVCQGVPLVAHNNHTGLVIENNVIDESTGAGGGCYGIQVNPGNPGIAESFKGTIIRNNKVINVGSNGISIGACPDCVVENNLIVQEMNRTFIGIQMPAENIEVGVDAADTNITVRNNSIYIAGGNLGSYGIRMDTYGTTHKVVSNLIVFGPATSGASCFSTKGLSIASFTAFNNNLCHASSGVTYSPAFASLAVAQAAGFDVNGLNVDPMLEAVPTASNGFAMKAKVGSPVLKAGNTLYSVVSGTSNIGAYDRTPPAPPSSIAIK